MIFIVSKEKRVNTDIAIVVDNLKEVRQAYGFIDSLVYIDGDDNESEFVSDLKYLKDQKGIGSLWYITEEETKKTFIELSIIGSGGQVITDTFYLQDYSLLSALISDGNQSNETTTNPLPSGVSILENFAEKHLSTETTTFPSAYALSVTDSINQLKEVAIKKSEQVPMISRIAIEKMEEASDLADSLSKEKDKLMDVVRNLESTLKDAEASQVSSNIAFFPRIIYKKEREIIRIKDIGRTSYLTSFMIGFQIYAQRILNKRPKLIFIEPVGSLIEECYPNYTWITSKNYNDMSLYNEDILFTNYPTGKVLTDLLEGRFFDTIIVVDRTINSYEHILNSRDSRPVWYSLSGSELIDKLKLNKSSRFRCFTGANIQSDRTAFSIPTGNYPSDKFDREAYYLNEGRESYRLLIKK